MSVSKTASLVYFIHFVTFGPGFIIIFNFSPLSAVNTMSECACKYNNIKWHLFVWCEYEHEHQLRLCVCVLMLTDRTGWWYHNDRTDDLCKYQWNRSRRRWNFSHFLCYRDFQSFYFDFIYNKLNDFYFVCHSSEEIKKTRKNFYWRFCWSCCVVCLWVRWIISFYSNIWGINRSNCFEVIGGYLVSLTSVFRCCSCLGLHSVLFV